MTISWTMASQSDPEPAVATILPGGRIAAWLGFDPRQARSSAGTQVGLSMAFALWSAIAHFILARCAGAVRWMGRGMDPCENSWIVENIDAEHRTALPQLP